MFLREVLDKKMIKNGAFIKRVTIAIIAILIFFALCVKPVYALSDAQSSAIGALLDEACRISGVPGISISIIDA